MNQVDEINDNLPCPVCGQDQCVCEIDPDDYEEYYPDDDEVNDVNEDEEES